MRLLDALIIVLFNFLLMLCCAYGGEFSPFLNEVKGETKFIVVCVSVIEQNAGSRYSDFNWNDSFSSKGQSIGGVFRYSLGYGPIGPKDVR